MTNRNHASGKVLCVLRWCCAAAMVLMLALLCWECLDIYLVGNSPENMENGVHIQSIYRWDDVGTRLGSLLLPAAACIALIILTCTAHAIGGNQSHSHIGIPTQTRLRLMKARVAELPEDAKVQEKRRKAIRLIAAAVISVCAVCCLAYLLNREHFTSWDLETVIGSMMRFMLPFILIAFAVAAAAALLCENSCCREIEMLKTVPKGKPSAVTKKEFPLTIVRAVCYAAAVLFIMLGVMNGGLRDVLVKAINICTECIGLG